MEYPFEDGVKAHESWEFGVELIHKDIKARASLDARCQYVGGYLRGVCEKKENIDSDSQKYIKSLDVALEGNDDKDGPGNAVRSSSIPFARHITLTVISLCLLRAGDNLPDNQAAGEGRSRRRRKRGSVYSTLD